MATNGATEGFATRTAASNRISRHDHLTRERPQNQGSNATQANSSRNDAGAKASVAKTMGRCVPSVEQAFEAWSDT